MYLVFHAFSRKNAGDGLLVDLTLEALEDAGIDRSECRIVALDADSFPDIAKVIQAPGEPAARISPRLFGAALEVIRSATIGGRLDGLARNARAIVAVGGGYLVGDSPVRQLGVLLNHYAQVRAAARSQKPSVYLPQSIGPLDAPIAPLIRRELRRLDRIYVRDDQSLAELPWPNVRRCADLAAMKLARSLSDVAGHAPAGGAIVLVARDLPRADTYVQRLHSLEAKLGNAMWAVQADVAGPRSDRSFYSRIGVSDSGALGATLQESPPAAVVSVRLHGAIAALLAGTPAIHLAYERKGWGAYQDLGLSDFVHDARTFDPDAVAAQVAGLRRDPSAYWARLRGSATMLQGQYAALIADLREQLPR